MGIHDKETEGYPVSNWIKQTWATSKTMSDFLDVVDGEPLKELPSAPKVEPSRIYTLASLKHSGKILAVDFDDTLIIHNKQDGSIVGPMPNVSEIMHKLKNEGWKIIINSHRAVHDNGIEEIKETMKKYNIPYDEIYPYKPYAAVYLDDKAMHFSDWNTAYRQLQEKVFDYKRDILVCEDDSQKMQWVGEKEVWVCPVCHMVKFLTKLAKLCFVLLDKRGS